MTRAAKILLPIIILAIGLGAYQLLASMREPPQKADRSYLGPLVEAIAVPAQKVQVTVEINVSHCGCCAAQHGLQPSCLRGILESSVAFIQEQAIRPLQCSYPKVKLAIAVQI